MVINLRTLPRGHSVLTQDVLLSEEDLREAPVKGTVSCTADVENMESRIYLRIQYGCDLTVACSRCLREFDQRVDGDFRLILARRGPADTDEEVDESVDYFFTEEDTEIDVRQSLYEEIMTNLPLKPLCSTACPGIDREATGSQAREESVDPRWEALRRLRDK